jgi:hypothetical protein
MAAAAALSSALASGAFEQLAPLCDAAELEVRFAARCAACDCRGAADALATRHAQAGSLASADWPHALHVLGHVVNNELCAPALRAALR